MSLVDRMWSTGEGNGKPLQYSCLENTINSMKRQKDRALKDELPRSVGAQYVSGDQWRITPERMKRQSQSKNNTQLWMWLMMEVKSGAVKSNTVYEPGMLGPWIKVNWKWSSQRLQEWTSTFLESVKLKGTGMDEFNSEDHYIYYCGQESL